MKFTRTEWEIILHRLECGDAIIEALTDHCDDELPACDYTKHALEDAIDMLILNGCTRTHHNDIELTVLRECCEGSTWFAGIDDMVALDRMTRGQATAYTRAANRLETKLNVSIPRA